MSLRGLGSMPSFRALLSLLTLIPIFASAQTAPAGEGTKVPVTFSGGYDTVGEDRGRPVILIASALGVSPEVFRKAFSQVKPAPAGERPEESQVRKNKQALIEALAPYQVTNDRLDEVSNFYRYNRQRDDLWQHTPAAAYAMVRDGAVVGITITQAGAGYSSIPKVTVEGMPGIKLEATISFGTDLKTNGSVKEIKIVP